ncbi:hypothetical protein CP533_5562 [Ophiocordyceps camponoti-saundersi (nom. inval.)]|nr:hypothetical protein CP533_5562 [Ophiocordyceps camponoti-saundersi (nom. inval.)]
MDSCRPRLRIAIIGGGIGGCAMANGLMRIPHLDTHVFEAAPDFSERGAALGLGSNHRRALAYLLSSVDETLAKAGAVPMASTRIMIGSGPEAGRLVFDLGAGSEDMVVHRASLLRELMAPLPRDRLHPGKKLQKVEVAAPSQQRDSMRLTFDDGTVECFDAVIGADGVFGFVRSHVLGEAAPGCAAESAGFWDCRNIVPMDKAKAVLGAEFFDQDRQYGWAGDGAFILHDVLDNGTMVQCVISAVETEVPNGRRTLLTKQALKARFSGWGHVSTAMIDLCLDQPSRLYGYSEMEHKTTPAYHNGHVCLMGDAAHATTPWQGAGAGLAFEDAMVLAVLLSSVSRPDDLDAAFEAYDAVRRPRCQRVIESSRAVGQVFCGQDREIGLDADKMRETLPSRWEFLVSLNMDEHRMEALCKLKEMMARR